MAGLFFCLASDTVQGFSFARMQYSPIQAFTACFAVLMQLYSPRNKTTHRALQWFFLRLRPLNCLLYQHDKSGHNTTCDTLEGIHAPGRAQPIPDTTATPGRCAGQHRPPIIIRYIRGCRGAHLSWIHARQCSISQTMPARRGLDASHVWRSGTGSAVRAGQSGTLHPAGQSSGRDTARNHWRLATASLFGLSPDS